jgi:hypothetical protein
MLETLAAEIRTAQSLLQKLQSCSCETLERCGRGILEGGCLAGGRFRHCASTAGGGKGIAPPAGSLKRS